MTNIDIKENNIYKLDSRLLEILLLDRTTKKNLIWATDNYTSRGPGYRSSDNISIYAIIKRNGSIRKPRVEKSKQAQAERAVGRAKAPRRDCRRDGDGAEGADFGRADRRSGSARPRPHSAADPPLP